MGRINFSHEMETDLKGITDKVYLNGVELLEWYMYSIPLNNTAIFPQATETPRASDVPGLFFQGSFSVSELVDGQVPDTYLDMSRWEKGYLWVNGWNLGRFWNIGPQQRLYVPGVWLQLGVNNVTVLDFIRTTPTTIEGFSELIPDIVELDVEYD